jgi:translation initiation factor IF-2
MPRPRPAGPKPGPARPDRARPAASRATARRMPTAPGRAPRTPRRGRVDRARAERRERANLGPSRAQIGPAPARAPHVLEPRPGNASTPARPPRRLHHMAASGRRRDGPPPRSTRDSRETLDPAAPFTGVDLRGRRGVGRGRGKGLAAALIRVSPLRRPEEATQEQGGGAS